ncbi:Lrp/AsnC family transcriptional regulator [Streptomyces sp. NPDC093228]|uniref:Lrp/AsnC family transcriptional regulator n=1 Tax=unclassified Streptomyces TaxID=2593676 RepID=UPI000740F36D|nr:MULTISPECIES: Lrp/AsnC family transcriptional regulator [unclassified Streptomyces]KUJ38800.1 AsnC family transcriptional regulator [Streptomyces sp. NRRL F-5122]REE64391.1 AsnC family transcriptional regulator [Streptomyces sp. 3212.3]
MERESLTLDKLDLQLLSALEIDGRASFSRIAAVLDVSDQTVARRYRRLCAEGGLRVVALRDAHRLGQDQWMLRVRCAPDTALTIADALAKRPDTYWIGLASGGTEVLCLTRPRTRGDHDDLLLAKLPRTPSVVEIRAHQLLHRYYGGVNGWIRKFGVLTDDQIAALRPGPPPGPGPVGIEPEDEPLLAVLERDGRATHPELQRATGRSESVVKRRLNALLASGAVYIDTEYNADLFGHSVAAVLWITAAPAALHSVGEALATHPEIAHASATAGPSNIVATAVVRSTQELYAYLSGPLGRLEGVQHVETTPFLRRVKQLTYQRPSR